MPVDVSEHLQNVSSVLIVSCPVCPPVSLAIQKSAPFIEVFKHGLKTGAFEDHIKEIRESLEKQGVRTGVFCTYAPVPTMCLWTKGQRKRLLKRATTRRSSSWDANPQRTQCGKPSEVPSAES
jgi:hypothetical protein